MARQGFAWLFGTIEPVTDPLIVPRAEHSISRSRIDPDALKVLYRLHQHGHLAYLVGGSVRDLLLGRQPKDFDIGTSAHPYEIKRLFRNCWIIGRRFRLAHVKFGTKTIEVATFRRKVPAADERAALTDAADTAQEVARGVTEIAPNIHVHHDNTFGTPQEDAFRRDFTLNALFYDIATFSLIDYTGGLADLRAGLIRCIGDPDERFTEDPVRMLRAVALAARLEFQIDPPILAAIDRKRLELARSAPPRLIEEFYKILRTGVAARSFQGLRDAGLLEPVAPELQFRGSLALWQSLEELDRYRRQSGIDSLTTPILIGTLLVPVGFHARVGQDSSVTLGMLPVARRDVDRLRQILQLQRRLLVDMAAPTRVRRGISHRSVFPEALTWLEIHGGAPAAVDAWRSFVDESPGAYRLAHADEREAVRPRRRRRRRGRFRRPPAQ